MYPGKHSDYVKKTLSRVLEKVTWIKSRTSYLKINGQGQLTPVSDLNTIVKVIWMLPGSASRDLRRKAIDTFCRVLGGDAALCRQIEKNNLTWRSTLDGEASRQALMEPMEYEDDNVSSRVRECSVRDTLASLVGGVVEVRTPSGLVDVLSDTEVIEVKHYRAWKHGLGQVLAYQSYFPHLAKRLHLFAQVGDRETAKYADLAGSVCGAHGVTVTFEEVAPVDVAGDDKSTVDGDFDETPAATTALRGNEWDQFSSMEARKRVATLEAETEWAVVSKKRALLEGAKLDAMISAIF